jgi:hypothetical protein
MSVMDRTTFLKNYLVRLSYDGTPFEPDRHGPAMSYEAADQRTSEPVSVTLIPTESIDSVEREQFEENVSVAQNLRHANVAKVLDFGREGDDYVYVSERLAGETLASWVGTHGPMAADAALRIGEQIVSVLSSTGFHKLPYPSIQPSDIMLVPGQTAEGSWPLVKVTNFGLPALMAHPEPHLSESESQQDPPPQQTSSLERFGQPTRDVRSEIYSLGVTLYFLLTGSMLSAGALERSPKFSGFPKPLRVLLGQLLHRDPEQRPKDLLLVTEMIRQCLQRIERRRALSDRYGIPIRAAVPRKSAARPRRLIRAAVVVAALLVLAVVIAPVVFPDSIGKMIGVRRTSKPGILIGVPEFLQRGSAPAPQVRQNLSTNAPAIVAAQPVNPTVAPEPQASTNSMTPPNPTGVRPTDIQQAQIASAQAPTTAPNDSTQNSAGATPDSSGSVYTDASTPAQANAERRRSGVSESSSQTKPKPVASKSKRGNAGQGSENASRGRSGSVRARFVGITSDGRLILRMPSGRTAIVAPDEENSVPRHRRRAVINHDDTFAPPPGFGPDYSSDD